MSPWRRWSLLWRRLQIRRQDCLCVDGWMKEKAAPVAVLNCLMRHWAGVMPAQRCRRADLRRYYEAPELRASELEG